MSLLWMGNLGKKAHTRAAIASGSLLSVYLKHARAHFPTLLYLMSASLCRCEWWGGYACLPASAQEEQTDGHADCHVRAVENVAVGGPHAAAEVATQAQHLQVPSARHHLTTNPISINVGVFISFRAVRTSQQVFTCRCYRHCEYVHD